MRDSNIKCFLHFYYFYFGMQIIMGDGDLRENIIILFSPISKKYLIQLFFVSIE